MLRMTGEEQLMGELKSAWEIAQEKASRLGKLSAEEEEQQRKQRARQIGQALAQKWLDSFDQPNVAAELNKYEEGERDLIRQASLNCLADAIDLSLINQATTIGLSENPRNSGGVSRVEKAIQGIASLEPTTQPIIEGITKLVQEYEGAQRKTRRELERKGRETLHQLRISGMAVGDINIEATSQWQQAQQRLIEALEPRLNSLKQELRRGV
jgi:hypothetical protein